MTEPVRYRPPGDRPTRHGRTVMLAVFWSAMALICGAAVVVTLVRETGPTPSACPPPRLCSGPPPVIPPSRLRTWTSRSLGVALEYPERVFSLQEQTSNTLRLGVHGERPSGVEATVWVTARPAGEEPPEAALRRRRSDLAASILGLTDDQDPATVIPRPRIGTILGVGGSFRGSADTPQGPAEPATALVIAAGNGHTTTVVSYVITGTDDNAATLELRGYLSPILTTFRWGR